MEPRLPSVFDYLYSDSRRTAAFLSQFIPSGVPQSVKVTESVSETAEDTGGANFSVNVGIIKTGIDNASKANTITNEGSERTFDPIWRNATSLLNFLTDGALINREINTARIGQFVLISGRLTLIDMSLLKSLWDVPEARENALVVAKSENPNAPPEETERNISVLFQMIKHLPHSPQCILLDGEGRLIWMLLQEEFLTGSASHLGLRYGMGIDGEWAVLGVIDALPSNLDESVATINAAATSIVGNILASEIGRILPLLRALGRPESAFGVTPLLIFRSVSG